jgi:hypothetical protein
MDGLVGWRWLVTGRDISE